MATNERNGALLKIGELAGRLGLNVRTLRYYEARGLLKPSARAASGYRLYSEADEQLLRFVLQAKHIGFSLEEIEEMVLRSRRGSPCDYVRNTLADTGAKVPTTLMLLSVAVTITAERPNVQPPAPTMPASSSDGCARAGCNVLLGGDSLGREARCR